MPIDAILVAAHEDAKGSLIPPLREDNQFRFRSPGVGHVRRHYQRINERSGQMFRLPRLTAGEPRDDSL